MNRNLYKKIGQQGRLTARVAKKRKKRLSVKEYFREAVEASEKNELSQYNNYH